MKQLFVLLVLVCLTGTDTRASDNAYEIFEEGSETYILAESADLHAAPASNGTIVDRLPSGTKVWILGDSGEPCTLNEYDANWYSILVSEEKDSKEGKEGFVCGAFLATRAVKSKTDSSLIYLYGLSKVKFNGVWNDVTLQLKVIRNGAPQASLSFLAVGQLSTGSEAESLGSKDVPGIKDIFKISFSDGRCAGAQGDAYFFWDGTHIFHAKTLTNGFDAPGYYRNYFLFPADEGGRSGLILQRERSGSYDEQNKDQVDSQSVTTWRWKNNSLVKIKTKKEK